MWELSDYFWKLVHVFLPQLFNSTSCWGLFPGLSSCCIPIFPFMLHRENIVPVATTYTGPFRAIRSYMSTCVFHLCIGMAPTCIFFQGCVVAVSSGGVFCTSCIVTWRSLRLKSNNKIKELLEVNKNKPRPHFFIHLTKHSVPWGGPETRTWGPLVPLVVFVIFLFILPCFYFCFIFTLPSVPIASSSLLERPEKLRHNGRRKPNSKLSHKHKNKRKNK